MTNLITCKNISKAFGAQILFRNIELTINSGDRIGVIGPNGSGKSTLLKIICGLTDADEGQVLRQKFLRLSYLAQEDVFAEDDSIRENLLAAIAEEPLDEAHRHNRVDSLLSRAEIADPAAKVNSLSGGWRKRLAICRALLVQPDILVMDEPTNHLDIEGIIWLEQLLEGPMGPTAFLLVSHDRRFLENAASRIVELSAVYSEGTLQVDGGYSRFVEVREEVLAGQRTEEQRLANKARREVEWLRRGPKARATKARFRVEEAHKLTDELSAVKARNRAASTVSIDFSSTGRKTKKLLEAKKLTKTMNGENLFGPLDLILSPGTKLGLIGRNGCGKSTLMKILAGAVGETGEQSVTADGGTITVADNVRVAWFDQQRQSLDPTLSLRRALAPEGDGVVYRGQAVHVVSWAQRFLFRPDQLETPVGELSGGEQARILIAGLMRQPADILLLDEPTNDLDIDSLDVLEASLADFPGAVVLVTHDRFLLDRLCDSLLGFGGADTTAYYSDYQQWLRDLPPQTGRRKSPASRARKDSNNDPKIRKGRLSYMEQREYDQIEDTIAQAETRAEELEARMKQSEVVADAEELARCWGQLERVQAEIEGYYERWQELEAKKEG